MILWIGHGHVQSAGWIELAVVTEPPLQPHKGKRAHKMKHLVKLLGRGFNDLALDVGRFRDPNIRAPEKNCLCGHPAGHGRPPAVRAVPREEAGVQRERL